MMETVTSKYKQKQKRRRTGSFLHHCDWERVIAGLLFFFFWGGGGASHAMRGGGRGGAWGEALPDEPKKKAA